MRHVFQCKSCGHTWSKRVSKKHIVGYSYRDEKLKKIFRQLGIKS